MIKLLPILFTLLSSVCYSQVIVYETYEDFQANNGTKYERYKSYSWSAGGVRLILFDKNNKKNKIACRDFWGFKIGDALFRVEKGNTNPVRVISVGKLVYYENGFAHLNMIRTNSTSGNFERGYYAYLSKNINSEIITMPIGGWVEWASVTKFKKENPDYDPLFQCIEQDYDNYRVGKCVLEFESLE